MSALQMAQESPAPAPPPTSVHVDLSGLADLIWRSLIDHLPDVGTAILTALANTIQSTAETIWSAVWHSSPNLLTQIPADLSYNFGPYRAVATDPVPVAIGGGMLALVLLGLRTIAGSLLGRDHVTMHVLTRLIPSMFLTLAYPMLIARAIGLVNAAAEALGSSPIGKGLVSGLERLFLFPPGLSTVLVLPYLLVWLVLLYAAIRLLLRVTYGLFRLLVALVFGPVALILWAIPQTEWVTWFWLRELIGWATTPLLVSACLAMAVPLAAGAGGFLSAAVFGIAGFEAAYDLVGVLGNAQRSRNLVGDLGHHLEYGARTALAAMPGDHALGVVSSQIAAEGSSRKYGHN